MRKNPLPPRSIKERMKEMESYEGQSSDVVKDFGSLTEDKILKTFTHKDIPDDEELISKESMKKAFKMLYPDAKIDDNESKGI